MAQILRESVAVVFLSLIALVSSDLAFATDEPAISSADDEFFETRIRPILAERCYSCHSTQSESVKGELWLDSRAGLLAGGESGPVVDLEAPDESRLIEAIRYADVDLQMPPKGKLPDGEIKAIEAWIRAGAPWPSESSPAARGAKQGFNLAERKASHWCWRPTGDPAPPEVRGATWPRDPLDRFVLATLEAAGMNPAPPAERHRLIRRLYFDLIGLPPSPEQVSRFLADTSPQAIEHVVDELLASPHFGERWARHWLDLVRYAETRGHEFDYAIPNAWAYRDYAIRALNNDLPYDQFVVEHIAGDLISPPRFDIDADINESLLATCSWFLGEWVHSPVDIRADETDRVANQIDVMSKAFLGMTVACARCHDHKFDAISTKDFYALAGFLHSSGGYEVPFQHTTHNRAVAIELRRVDEESRGAIGDLMTHVMLPVASRLVEYLLAARQIVQGGRPEDPSDRAALIDHIADEHRLDAAVLTAWLRSIESARSDPFDPLHPWAEIAFDRSPESPLRIAELLKPSIDAWTAEAVRARQATQHQLIVDYGRPRPGEWISTGLGFGDAPETGPTLMIGSSGERPIAGVLGVPSAMLQISDSRLPSMLRTPTFVIESPTLHYQVAGEGAAFVVVDSYRLLEGPLHGGLKKSFKFGNEFAWQTHDVRDYVGHRAHIEFTPTGGSQLLGVVRVTQGGPAESEACRASRLVLSELTRAPVDTIADAAARMARAIGAACNTLVGKSEAKIGIFGDAMISTADASDEPSLVAFDRAFLANWLSSRLELVGFADSNRPLIDAALSERARRLASLKEQLRPSPVALVMVDGTPFDERVLIRGNHRTTGDIVPRRFLEAIDASPVADARSAAAGRGSGRLELARKLVDPHNPLTARVYVNRVWQHLLGRGIVASVDNFGVLGEPPSHPELLDHLSQRFVREGWSTKRLIRSIVLSSTYQMASKASAEFDAMDPDNRLFHKGPIKRLEGEPLRDAILAISGRLDRTQLGPSVPVHLTSFMTGRGRPGENGQLDGNGRRSIYIAMRRNFLPPMMLAFDMPVPLSTMGRRNISNVPAQALILLNDPFVIDQSRRWAERALSASTESVSDRVAWMYESAFARPPSDAEQAAVQSFLQRQADTLGLLEYERNNHPELWAELAHVLFNAKEFYFIE